MIEKFKWEELWYDLACEDRTLPKHMQRSRHAKAFHKRAGWKHATEVIMEHGLPKLCQPESLNDVTAHITALGEFATAVAKWLKRFAAQMHAYVSTPEYQKNLADSHAAMKRREERR